MDDTISEVTQNTSGITRPIGFQIQFEKILPNAARKGLGAWSPQHDLLCFVTSNENVLLYRMNGQRVWGLARQKDKDVHVNKLQWRPDGKMIALGYSDGVTRICDVNNGKMVHLIRSDVSGFGRVTCLGWVDNRSVSKYTQKSPTVGLALGTLEKAPKALLDMEVSQVLPRLSVLPSASGSESLFSSKATLDSMINAVKSGDIDILDVLIVGDEAGNILLNIFDSFVVGTLQLSSLCPYFGSQCSLIFHASTPSLATHLLLVRSPKHLYLTALDLLFTSHFGQYLHQLAFTSTKLQALLKYVGETVNAMQSEWKAMNDLAQRYVNLLDEALRDAGNSGGVSLEFFELLVTGVGSAGLKEWLVDVLTERGQKRWEKTSTSGYENLRRLVHENLLPTCDRLIILLCRLRGLARWKEQGSPLGLEPSDFTRCIDAVSGLTIYAHSFMQVLNHEFELFRAFSLWLKNVLDKLSSVINIGDHPPEDPQTDTLKVAEYVGKHLVASHLIPFFQSANLEKGKRLFDHGESVFGYFSKGQVKKGKNCSWGDLTNHLIGLCDDVFEKPARAMRRLLRIARPVTLHNYGSGIRVQIRMIDDEKGSAAYAAMYSEAMNPDVLIMIRIQLVLDGGLSTIAKIGCTKVNLYVSKIPLEGEDVEPTDLKDFTFVDDQSIILLVQDNANETTYLLSASFRTLSYDHVYPLPLTHSSNHRRSSSNFSVAPHADADTSSQSVFDFANGLPSVPLEPLIIKLRTFAWANGFLPERVMVNGKQGRRIGAVVGEEGSRYIVFDLDEDEVEEEGEEDGEEEDDEQKERLQHEEGRDRQGEQEQGMDEEMVEGDEDKDDGGKNNNDGNEDEGDVTMDIE